jgi:integrase
MPIRRVPSYRHHKPSGQAVVTLDEKDFYLGPWNSKASRREYDRLTGEWLANGRRLPASLCASQLTITELAACYWEFAQTYYVKNGEPSGQLPGIRVSMRILRQLYGHLQVHEFGPLSLRALQQHMIELDHSRRYINDNCARVKRAFKWGVSRELVPSHVHEALTTVPGLKRGRSKAREAAPVLPVSEADFLATLPELPGVVRAMVELQRLTGCRPGEVCLVRPCDVDRSGDVWCYVPLSHKTEHHNRQRRIYVGPRAAEILRPWLVRGHATYCFSPQESARSEKSHHYGPALSLAERAQLPRPSRRGDHYTKDSYRRAIVRACGRAGVESWSPNQLRHSCATQLRRRYGLEAAQTILGHSNADVTQVYAERDFGLAERIMRECG